MTMVNKSSSLSVIYKLPSTKSGFTIVELLVVIVVIGILAAITIVSYTGISQKATVAAVQSDLDNAAKKLKLYYTLYASYPTAMDGNNCPTAPNVDTGYCLQSSGGSTLTYTSVAPTTFRLNNTKGSTSYSMTDSSAPTIATTINGSTTGTACPTGFIPVPGSGTYGTNDFCAMKYEAKNDGGGNAVSTATGSPWVSISQTSSITTAAAACTGCHLITDAEYLTIAQNVLSVASNWSGAAVGSGYIYSGHNDNAPGNALVADPSDANGYAGETNTGGNQKRTLTLTNGQVIWDLAGNVWEWTASTTTGGQPGIASAGYNWREWTTLTTHGTLSPDPYPATTGITGSNTWTSAKGIGQIYSSADEVGLRAFLRGGYWGDGGNAGVLTLTLNYAPSTALTLIGFRVSR